MTSPALNAQSWCAPGAVWTYSYDGWGSDYRMEYRYTGDTLFEGRMAKKCVWTEDGLWMGGPHHATGVEYTAVAGDAILAWTRNWGTDEYAWDTLAWFGAMPGDRWYPPGEDRSCPPNGMIEVLDTGSVEIGGLVLRRLQVRRLYGDDGDWGNTGYITERIGMTPRYPEVISCDAVIDYFFPHFVCYSDDQVQLPAGVDCSISLGFAGQERNSGPVTTYPNPGTDGFRLSGIGASKAEGRIMDMQGRVLESMSVVEGEHIGTAHLSGGNYVVEVRTDGVQVHRLRWVKQ